MINSSIRKGYLLPPIMVIGTLIIMLMSCSKSNPVATIRVNATSSDFFDAPVYLVLDSLVLNSPNPIALWERVEDGEIQVPYQIDSTTNKLWWVLNGHTPKGCERTFLIRRGKTKTLNNGVSVSKSADAIQFSKGEKPILQYNHGTIYPTNGVDTIFRRSGFIHPIWSPSGDTITRIHPPDHYHHFGLWNPWTKTTFEGEEIDFWNLGKRQGTVKFLNYESIEEGTVYGKFRAHKEHVVYPDSSESKRALLETWEVKVFGIGDSTWLIDFTSTISCATSSPIIFEKYRYGGFTLRGDNRWSLAASSFLTSEGNTYSNANGSRARWCIANGPANKGRLGIFMAGSTENYNHPEPLRIWEPRPDLLTGDLFVNFSTTMDTSWHIVPDRTYRQSYRMVVMSKEIDASLATQLWNGYAESPDICMEVEPKQR